MRRRQRPPPPSIGWSFEVWAVGRFAKEMLGDTAWAGFRERARTVFADRFPDPLHDRHDVLLAIGIKE